MLPPNLQSVHLCLIHTFQTTELFALTSTFLSQLFTKQRSPVVNLRKLIFLNFIKILQLLFSNVENLDLDSLVKFFNSTMTLIRDKHAPLKTVTVTPRNKNPWFTPNLLTERRKRR